MLVLLAVLPAHAEGNVMELRCTDAAGGAVDFTLAPQELDETGKGRYLVSGSGAGSDTPVSALADGFSGPFLWNTPEAVHALAVRESTGATAVMTYLIWPRAVVGAEAQTTTLTCETAP